MPSKLSLPLVVDSTAAPDWQGLAPAGPLPEPLTDAEPLAPQGAYNPAEPEAPLSVPLVAGERTEGVELLAPAGGLDAAFAAFHYGADAIYLGLKKFSARAEAENFTFDELDEITAYAHSLEPRRRVFVTVNTLIRQDELPELIEALVKLEELGVDAVILQDLGVYGAIRRFFPDLELHGSTQMAIHNRAGAEVLTRLGFRRVVLARELTFEEVHDITRSAGIQTEVFVHGALCYAYSGLCLFSAQTLGRSGNRGKCAYSCRDSYEVSDAPTTLRDGSPVRRDPATGFPFSMKDLALPDHVPALRAAGVFCFKIEGRKKSPLYVATTTDYYRRLLEGRLDPGERPNIEADLQTVFSRPWTRLFLQSHKDKEVADRDTVGHRGTIIGKVDRLLGKGHLSRLRFRTRRPLERHDGLQIDLDPWPVLARRGIRGQEAGGRGQEAGGRLGKPFGFPIDQLWLVDKHSGKLREAFDAPAGALVEVGLPAEHPDIPPGAPVYCSSSQAVKQKYRHDRPKARWYRVRKPLEVNAVLRGHCLTIAARAQGEEAVAEVRGPFPPCLDRAAMEAAVRAAFTRLGNTPFALQTLTFRNEACGFLPVSQLNRARRQVLGLLEERLDAAQAERIAALQTQLCVSKLETSSAEVAPTSSFRWSIKVDRVAFLDEFDKEDWRDIDEVIIDIARDQPSVLRDKLARLAEEIGPERIRLALPAITRKWEEKGLEHKIEALRQGGWKKWEAANLSAWAYLGLNPTARCTDLDLATDWSVYVLNRLAAQELLDMGVSRFVLSPEDGLANWTSLLAEFGSRTVLIVYQDTPLFLAESCAYANLIGGCPGKANCKFESMDMISSHGEKVTALDYHCRTIVLNQGPYCLSTRLGDVARAGGVSLRADFIYRPYEPGEVKRRWHLVRAGRPVPGGHAANLDRGLL
jgi:putative protease